MRHLNEHVPQCDQGQETVGATHKKFHSNDGERAEDRRKLGKENEEIGPWHAFV